MAINVNLTSNSPVSASASLGTTETVGSPHQDDLVKFEQIAIGKQLQGQIVKTLDGNSIIKINNGLQTGSIIQLRLPAEFKVGDQLILTLLSNDNNQPRFSVSLQTVSLGNTVISVTGQLLSHILEENPAPNRITGTTALITSSEPDPTQLASRLNNAINNSGVFYESHLKQWSEGQRTVEQIRQEPQNNTLVNNQLIPMQLEAMDNKHFAWQGEVWPGQAMQWDVHKDENNEPNQNKQNDSDDNTSWNTTIKLDTPNLGHISATISIKDEVAHLQLHANNADVVILLKKNSEQLIQSFASSGISLENLQTYFDNGST
jgi:flagellar hook-length control protein FliK